MRNRFWILLVAAALLCAPLAVAGDNGRRTTRIGPEEAVGGLTVAEQAAHKRQLHAELSTVMPAGVGKSPVRVDITQKDRDDLAAPHDQGKEPLRIGVVKSLPEATGKPFGKAFNRGVIKKNPDGSFVWAMTVTSPEAQATRLHFTGFSLPDRTEMYVMGTNGQAHGPYVGKGRNGDGDFWTRSIVSDSSRIVLRYNGTTPDIDLPKMSFVLSDVGHIRGRPPRAQFQNHDDWPCSDNASCMVDAECVNVPEVVDAKDGVAKMEWITGQFINTCTGGLLNDTDGATQIPYFLTANHCTSSSISNMETFFNYTTESCNGGCPDSLVTGGTPPAATTIGFTVVASGSSGDFTLGKLNQDPPTGQTFLGWNNTQQVANTNGADLYRISNANFGPQVYSQHDVDTGSPTCSGIPRGAWIYSKNQTGDTMGGSSGSPVVNSDGDVVGQLTGCCGFNCAADCDPVNNWTIDGALNFYWDSVADFLDPQAECTINADCQDNLFCTGTETCVSGSCQSSGDPCTGGDVCNEATDTCDTPPQGCDNDGACEANEDCNNCPNDCRQKTNGSPNSRYCCCDGDLPDCGDSRCNESGWSCGDSSCTGDPDCNDLQFCNGVETCSGGTCQSGSNPCPQGCDETNDVCVSCAGNKASCNVNSDCCSNNCKNGSCKGN